MQTLKVANSLKTKLKKHGGVKTPTFLL